MAKRKYTKSFKWHSNQTKRSVGAAHRRSDKAMGKAFDSMGCLAILAILTVGTTALVIGWNYI